MRKLWGGLTLLICAALFLPSASEGALPLKKTIALTVYENSANPFKQGMDIGAAEAIVSRMLMEKGYPLVKEDQLRRIKESKAARLALDGDVEGLLKLGSSYNVRIFVTGRVVRHDPVKNPLGTYTGTASIAVRAYTTADGKYIFSDTADGKALGGSPDEASERALHEAARLMGEKLTGEAPSVGAPGRTSPTNLTLRVSGVSDFGSANRILDCCKNLSGTVSAKLSGYGGGVATVSLVYRGDAKTFAELLSTKGVGVSVQSIAGDTVLASSN